MPEAPARRRFLRPLALAFATAGALAPGRAVAQEPAPPAAEAVRCASLAGIAEEGRFTLYLAEEPLVQIEHHWRPDGTFDGRAEFSMAGQQIVMTVRVESGADGQWTRIESRTPQYEGVIFREGNEGVVALGENEGVVALGKKEPERHPLVAGMVLFDNYQPALVRVAVAAYDAKAGGAQVFPALIVPGARLDATLERLETVERTVAGSDLAVGRYRFSFPSVDMFVWAAEDGRVLAIDVPAQHASYVREGFESLLAPAETDPLLSAATFEWVLDDEVAVPMRDGTRLATDVYRPAAEGRFPTILVRTPYKKEMSELQGKYFARRGYAYAVQDCRGRFASEGTWEPFFPEPADGHDAIEWVAAQPWSTGKVGMIGGSYLGWVQWWAARERPPHLVTIIPNVAPPDPWFNIPYEYGCFFLTGAIWWADVLEQEATADLTGGAMKRVSEKDYHELLKHLPVIELDEKVLGKKNHYWREWIAHPTNDEWWDRASFLSHLAEADLPVFHQSGWFDGDGIGTKLNYLAMASHGHAHQKLVVGPWGHTDTSSRSYLETDFGPDAVPDLQREYLRWFDRWLKGVDNGIDREPLVRLFVMGANRWATGDSYPLPGTQTQRWYLRGAGKANTAKGDGVLSATGPGPDEPPDRYDYDPGDPTPAPRMPPGEVEDADELSAYYARIDDERADILVYQTPPLERPLAIAGPITAVLHAASSAKDTDWFVRLSEIGAEGKVFFLVEGKIRARYRRSGTRPELLAPGAIEEYRIDCWHAGIEVPAGNRLRVEIASAAFPLFSRNLNTGGHDEMETEFVTAHQTVYHDAAHPSHLVLPVLPAPPDPGAAKEVPGGR
ncbi:MAG: CocE/NonD family hydrolase [Planctomycetota bacterium]